MHKKLLDIRKTLKIITTEHIDISNAKEKKLKSFDDVAYSPKKSPLGLDIYKAICSELNGIVLQKLERKMEDTKIEVPIFKDVVCYDEIEFTRLFTWNTWIERSSLSNLLYTIFVREKLIPFCKITKEEFVEFLNAVSYTYNGNKYHNVYHALDITVRGYFLYKKIENRYIESKSITLSLLLGCLLHDAGHLGFRSVFLANNSKLLFKKFGSESLNEKMHFFIARILLKNKNYSIIKNLKEKEQEKILKNIEDMILSTDLQKHAKYVKMLDEVPEVLCDIIVKGPIRMSKIVLITLLKITDLSNSTTDYAYFHSIGDLVISEENDERHFTSESRWLPMNGECNNYKLSFLETYLLDYCSAIGRKFAELRFLYDKVLENSRLLRCDISDCNGICKK